MYFLSSRATIGVERSLLSSHGFIKKLYEIYRDFSISFARTSLHFSRNDKFIRYF